MKYTMAVEWRSWGDIEVEADDIDAATDIAANQVNALAAAHTPKGFEFVATNVEERASIEDIMKWVDAEAENK